MYLGKTINLETKEISKNLDNWVECISKNIAFTTLKNHKVNFISVNPCHLINPCKLELCKISKIIMKNINKTFRKTEYGITFI